MLLFRWFVVSVVLVCSLFLFFLAISSRVLAQSCPALPANTGSAALTVQIPDSGTYAIWTRMRPGGDSANAIWLQIDDTCGMVVGDLNGMAANTFVWVNFKDGSSASRITVPLSAGQHVVTLRGKEANTGVDRLLVTTDMNCTPSGMGDNCIGPVVSVTPTGTAAARVSISLGLHGIGTGGDNANPVSTGNMSPQRPQRTILLTVLNDQNQQAADVSGSVQFNSQTGKFDGAFALPGTVSSGVYTMRVGSVGYLRKVIPGIVTLSRGQTTQLPSIVLTTGDANSDNALSILDYNLLLDCFSDLAPARNCADMAKKQMTDFTDDGAVNQFDYNLFLRELSTQGGQ